MPDVIDVSVERRADLRAMGLLALLITVLYADVLFLGANFFTRDLTGYFYPMKWVVREVVLGGDFPFWNRLYSAGQPLAANPAYEVFYPPQWLTFLPDYNYGFQLHIVIHVFIAAFGAFRFLRSIELGVPASFVGAMVFVTCGPYVSTINLLPILFSISWMPWIALYARRWILERRRRDFVLAALFLGLQAILCEPTTLLQTWGVIALYAAFAGWRKGGVREASSSLARSAGLVATGIAVAAIQFVPAADHARDSVRAIGFPLSAVPKWSFAPVRFFEHVFPNLLGTQEAQGSLFWGERFYPGSSGQNAYWVIRNGLWPATPALAGIPTCFELDIDETQLIRTRAVIDIVEILSNRGVYDWVSVLGPMYGSGPVLVYRDPVKELRRIRGDWSRIEPVDLEPTPRYPRYFFASQMVDAADDARLTDMLARQPWDQRTAFVRTGSRPVGVGRVIAARESANRTEIEVEADADAFLVLASTHHKYWRATLDGKPAGITETNIAFQGIAVPKGRHRVELRYHNPMIATGAIITILSLAALGLVWLRGEAARRGGNPEV